MTDSRIHAFCAEQRELLELELQSEQQQQDVTGGDEFRSHVLHQLQLAAVSVGLYGRTVVHLESSSSSGILPAHRFTTGDQVEIRSKASALRKTKRYPAGVISQVTDQSISVALFGAKPQSRNIKKGSNNKTQNDDDDDDEDLLGSPPYSLLPQSSIEVHKKLLLALDELEKHGTDHPVAGEVVRALFDPSTTSTAPPPKQLSLQNKSPHRLDDSQQQAIDFCLSQHRPVSLIHGPPGTGKTTTVVELIQRALQQQQGYGKILVTAPSNVAVDNVLQRLLLLVDDDDDKAKATKQHHKKLRVVRLGHPARLQANILPYSLEALVQGADETAIVGDVRRELQGCLSSKRYQNAAVRQEIRALRKEIRTREQKVVESLLRNAQVILATCVGAGNTKLLADLQFDLVVIDEAAQALEAACWIPALKGKKLVLAGDHCQLPPTIKSNSRSVQEGLGNTMFERVMHLYGDDERTGPGRVSRMLQVQYRMHQKIADWASHALYGGALQTHQSVKDRTLAQLNGVQSLEDDDDDVLSSPLVLIDTAGCDMHESTNAAGSRFNTAEAELVQQHVGKLLDAGVPQNQIAVITPYNGQVEILRAALLPTAPQLEIRSVDGFQGGEREAVVLSLVRSSGGIGFLRDDRRLNVAVTRAKRHCCVICDSDTVSQSPFVRGLVSWMEEHGQYRSAMEYVTEGTRNNGQIESDLLQAQIEMEKLMRRSQGVAKPGGTKKDPVDNRKDQPSDPQRTALLLEKIKSFAKTESPGAEMQLSTELTKADRKAVHELAEELKIGHCSTGVDGVNRRTTVSIPQPEAVPEAVTESPAIVESQASPPATAMPTSDDELVPEQSTITSFAALVDDQAGSEEEHEEESEEDASPDSKAPASMNTTLGDLARERAQREAGRNQEHAAPKKKTSKKKKGKKLGGAKKVAATPNEKDDDDADLDDMAFLDAQIEKVQNSHGRTIAGKGSSYRTMMNGILLSKPAPAEKKKDSRASAALQSKLKQAQGERRAKTKKKK